MPYPRDKPTAKHDFLYNPNFLSCENLIDTFGYLSDESLLEAVTVSQTTNSATQMGSVYTYNDSPSPALSRSLCIIGILNANKSTIGKLLSDDDNVPSFVHRCTIAVKLADDRNASELSEEVRSNSRAFATLLRNLKKEGAMAILGADKFHRVGILVPTDDIVLSGCYEAQDFAAVCYVCTVDNVRKFSSNAPNRVQKRPLSSLSENDDNDVWKPPAVDGDIGFWQPPQSPPEITNFTSTEFSAWQPSNENVPWDSTAINNEIDNHTNAHFNGKTNNDSKFHADEGAAAADRFYSGLTRTLDTRAESRLYHMRAFNGWVKATQIQELDPKTPSKKPNSPLRILDLACGKGGDLGKWVLHPRGVQNYVGIDVARGSLVDAAIRARSIKQKLKRCTFTCADLGADVPGRLKTPKHKRMQKLSTWSLDTDQSHGYPEFKFLHGGGVSKDDKFDVVSIQFAIHYMMETKKRALRFFQTVSELLEVGGNLIVTTIDARVVVNHLMNMGLDLHFDDEGFEQKPVVITVGAGACRIKFKPEIVKQIFETKINDQDDIPEKLFGLQYSFTLVEGSDHASGVGEAVDLPEWLIPIPVLEALGQKAGLEIEYAKNFHEFYEDRSDPVLHASAHSSMYNMKVLNRNGSISVDEYEISGLYLALKFRKVRESIIQIDDLDNEEYSDGDEDDLADVDPTLKAKLYPMALLQAKNNAGSDTWATLTSEQKKDLTEIELRKLIPKS